MREMKDSGVPWIGEIPKDWSIRQASQIFAATKHPNNGLQENNLLSLSYGRIVRKSIETSFGLLPESFEGYNIIDKDTIVLRLTDLQNDQKSLRVGIATEKGIITSAYLSLRCITNDTPQYLYYLLHCFDIVKGFYGMGGGIRQGLTWDGVKNLRFYLPNQAEQQRIADFLDAKCAEIDTILEQTRESIDEYKKLKQSVITEAVTKGIRGKRPMKDSSVEWIREIPEDWAICRGKTIMTILERSVKEDDGVITCFRDGEVTLRSKRREEGFTFSLQEAGYQGIEPGDLVVHGMDGFAGAIGISDSRGKATPVLNVLDSQENKRFLMYQMRAMAYCGLFLSLSTGIRVRSCDTNWNKLKVIRYFIPSRKEQDAIVSFLDNTLPAIDSLIASKEALIAELESYKKSIIYEYVTGKQEV